jgi:branched-chain amino acid transport system substrate-binding protein
MARVEVNSTAAPAIYPMRLRSPLVVFVLACVAVVILFRHNDYRSSAAERSSTRNNWAEAGFSVGVVWPEKSDTSLLEGIQLALEELNARGGPFANKIRLRYVAERPDPGSSIARQFASYGDMLAVIGYELADNAIPSSLVYEQAGILFLSPKTTAMRLTTHGFRYVFRMTPDDHVMMQDVARFAASQGWKRIGVIYGQGEHGLSASDQFIEAAHLANLGVPFIRSYIPADDWVHQDHRAMVSQILKLHYDAVMIADQMPSAAKLLVDMARMGQGRPVLATDKLDTLDIWTIAQVAANGLYVASAVDPESKEPAYQGFRARFQARFHRDPSYGASQGYEAFTMLTHAYEISHSADPIVVATTLKTVRWQGLFGEFAFSPSGDVQGRDVSIKQMRGGHFATVSTIQEDVSPTAVPTR